MTRKATHTHLSRRARIWLIIALSIPIAVLTLIEPPIAQDPSYHQFADQQMMLGIPNFLNVVSNLAFLVAGVIGLRFLRRHKQQAYPCFIDKREEWPYLTLFLGVALTSRICLLSFSPR